MRRFLATAYDFDALSDLFSLLYVFSFLSSFLSLCLFDFFPLFRIAAPLTQGRSSSSVSFAFLSVVFGRIAFNRLYVRAILSDSCLVVFRG
jgi:hypothetical protein